MQVKLNVSLHLSHLLPNKCFALFCFNLPLLIATLVFWLLQVMCLHCLWSVSQNYPSSSPHPLCDNITSIGFCFGHFVHQCQHPPTFFLLQDFFWYWREGCHLHAGIRAVDHPATWCLCHTSCMQFFFSFSIVFLLKPVEFALIGCIFLVVAFLVYWACCSWTTFFPYLLSSWKKALVFFQLLLTVYRNHTSRFQVST